MTHSRSVFLATASTYVVVTFTIAAIWHAVVFRDYYEEIDYFHGGEPGFALGLATIVIQGVVLASVHPSLGRDRSRLRGAARSAGVLVGTIASVQVLGAAAKNHAPTAAHWFLFEGLFFAVMFLAMTLALRLLPSPTAGGERRPER